MRISLGGGGTDLKSYYQAHGGFLIAGALNKYIYVGLNRPFIHQILLKYSEIERVDNIDQIKHPVFREALRLVGLRDGGIELTSLADIPGGTGLGSSSAFTCALLRALWADAKIPISQEELAQQACHIEIDVLGDPIGKQDQYASAYGGLNSYTFQRDGKVIVEPLKISDETLCELEDNLLLFFTGISRSASSILKEQDTKSKEGDQAMIDNLYFIKQLGFESKRAFESGDLREFAEILKVHWEYKKQRSANMTNSQMDKWYDIALKNGALGGKQIGAGGGGFFMFYAEDRAKLRKAMAREGLSEVRYKLDWEGTKIVSYI
jgi:D-glycero-alpha-D-manno-heptose-7-phosphate kinase